MAAPRGIGMMANLIEAVQNFSVVDCARIIEQHPESVNVIGWSGITALHKAALRGNPDIVQLLIDKGANMNQPNNAGETPIHYACKRGSPIVLHLLVKHGATVDEVDSLGRGCVHHASSGGSLHVLQYLVEIVGLSFNKRDKNGISPLHIASEFGHFDTVRYLLKNKKTDVHWMDHAGNIPLHAACLNAHGEIVWVLLQKGTVAQLHQKNKEGLSPLDIARDGTSFRHGPLAKELGYWATVRNQDQPPKGPLFVWYLLLFLPIISFTLIICMCSYLGVYGSVASLFGILILTWYIGRQMHRLPHICRWDNPIFFGAFAGGLFHTSVCYYYLVLPTIWPTYFYLGFPTYVLMVYQYIVVLTREPGMCRVPRRRPGKESTYMTIEHIATREIEADKYCVYCEMSLPDRTRHCKLCEHCMVEMDHHCLFLLRCVATNTHRLFMCFIMVVIAVQIIFIFSAAEFIRVSYPQMPLWDLPSLAFSQQVWVFIVCLVNILSIVWGVFLLQGQLDVVSSGYTTVIRPPINSAKLLTFADRLNNVYNFFLGRKTLSIDEICEMKAKSILDDIHPI